MAELNWQKVTFGMARDRARTARERPSLQLTQNFARLTSPPVQCERDRRFVNARSLLRNVDERESKVDYIGIVHLYYQGFFLESSCVFIYLKVTRFEFN